MSDDPKLSPGRPTLTVAGRLGRLAVIGIVMAGAAAAFACAGEWLSPDRLAHGRTINRFQEVNELPSGFRGNHAKGVCIAGFFESNGAGSRLSKAAIFERDRVLLIGRFGGRPSAMDSAMAVRSLALRFSSPGGEEQRAWMNSIPIPTINTPEGVFDQLTATPPDPATSKPDPDKMLALLASHPETIRAAVIIRSQRPHPASGNAAYHRPDAFPFIDVAGTAHPVLWSMAPIRSARQE